MPYRDLEALKTRHAALSKDLAEIQAKAKELAGLASEEERVRRSLAETEAMLREAAPQQAPLRLETLTVTSPCSASWQDMTGDDRARFCGKCEKNVYNLSAMSALEAEAILREKEDGDVCVRFFQRADGTVMTADCPVGVRRKRIRRLAVLATAGGALSAVAAMMLPQGATSACPGQSRNFLTSDGPHAEHTLPQGDMVPMMGSAVAMPPPPPPEQHRMGKAMIAPRPVK